MASFRDYVVRVSQHTYFLELKHLRFQILFFAGLVLVPLCCGLGWPTTFAALTDNLLFVDGWSQVFIIFLLCLISSWTGMVMIFIVLDLGPRRFGVDNCAATSDRAGATPAIDGTVSLFSACRFSRLLSGCSLPRPTLSTYCSV